MKCVKIIYNKLYLIFNLENDMWLAETGANLENSLFVEEAEVKIQWDIWDRVSYCLDWDYYRNSNAARWAENPDDDLYRQYLSWLQENS